MADKEKNPNNPQSDLFRKLTRLFSGPIVNWRTQANRKIKRTTLDNYATKFKSLSGQPFRRNNYSPFEVMNTKLMAQQNRTERYVDYEQMEYMPEIASAIDIYADEMTTHSSLQPMLSIACANEEIKSTLSTLYHSVMNVDHNLFGWCRSLVKFGDFLLYLDIDDEIGIKSTIALPIREVERLEGEDPTNPNYVQYQWNSAGITFENWQVAHFRILGNDKYAPYGTSVLEPARRIWRQLVLLEDAMMAYRITRSAERRVFYIDVGNIAPQDVETFIQKTITSFKRNQVVDATTGRVDLRYNPLSVEEDYFIPIRGGEQSKIESLPGGQYVGQIDDVKYLRDKLFSAIKVPASYLSQGEEGSEDKTTLAQKDIRFARTVQRLQRSVISELEKLGIVHLYTLGFRGDDLINFKLSLNNPSKLAELQELEHWKSKFDIAGAATENFFSRRWVSEKIFAMSDEDFLRNQREIFTDRQYDAALEAATEAAGEREASALGAGESLDGGDDDFDLGGEGGGDDLSLDDLGGDEGGDLDLGGDEGGAEATEEPVLPELPAAGKRDDKRDSKGRQHTEASLEPQAKGKKYVAARSRGGDKRTGQAARTRSLRYSGSNIPLPKSPFPGWKGNGGMSSLSKGVFQEENTIYTDRQEIELFETTSESKRLIEQLENIGKLEKKPNENEA